MVKIIVGNVYSCIIGDLPFAVDNLLYDAMAYSVKNYQFTGKFKQQEWDGYSRLYQPGKSFYTGLLSYVRDILLDAGVEFSIDDKRKNLGQNFNELEFILPEGFTERDYQNYTVEKCLKYSRGIIGVATGGGKTFIATKLIGAMKVKPAMFYVLSKDLMYQAKETMELCLNTKIGIVGDGKLDIQDVNVCTIQTAIRCLHAYDNNFDASKYKYDSDDLWDEKVIFSKDKASLVVDLIKNCRGMYFDEVHHVTSETCREIMVASENAYYRFGGSATLERADGEEIVIQALFGKKVVDISASYLIKNNYLVVPHIFFAQMKWDIPIGLPYRSIFKKIVTDNEEFNEIITENVLFLERCGKTNLILVQQIKHGKSLQKMIPDSILLVGKDSSKKRNKAIQDFRDGNLKTLIATSLADEGLDIRCLDAVHMVGSGSSPSRIPQRVGRVLRLSDDKPYGIAIYYHHQAKSLYEQGRDARIILSREPEFKIYNLRDHKELKCELAKLVSSEDSLFGEDGQWNLT